MLCTVLSLSLTGGHLQCRQDARCLHQTFCRRGRLPQRCLNLLHIYPGKAEVSEAGIAPHLQKHGYANFSDSDIHVMDASNEVEYKARGDT